MLIDFEGLLLGLTAIAESYEDGNEERYGPDALLALVRKSLQFGPPDEKVCTLTGEWNLSILTVLNVLEVLIDRIRKGIADKDPDYEHAKTCLVQMKMAYTMDREGISYNLDRLNSLVELPPRKHKDAESDSE